jgi:AraC family transcriptional regulator, arabinose operon regulatory protein
MTLIEGFADERMFVLPRPAVADALAQPVTRRLVVTDVGWFPNALHHARFRPDGAEEHIVLVCVNGGGWVNIGGQHHGIGASTVAIVPARVPHSYGSSDTSPWTIWWCHLRGSDAAELVEATGASAERPVVPLWNVERCVALVDEMLSGLERDHSPARLVAAAGSAWKLLTQITSDRLMPERGDPLERAMSYLAERLDTSVRVPDLARVVGISPSHLTALFRRATGGGILAHHTSLRMARARQLLDRTTLNIGEVAARVGYDDPLYFSRQFRRVHGVSPSDYRLQHKG